MCEIFKAALKSLFKFHVFNRGDLIISGGFGNLAIREFRGSEIRKFGNLEIGGSRNLEI